VAPQALPTEQLHEPALQNWLAPHWMPQPPQLLGSVSALTHAPLHITPP
jgi:hypothetical protein